MPSLAKTHLRITSVLTAALLVAVAVVLSACGGGEGNDDPLAASPAGAFVFVDAAIDPSGDQEDSVRAIIEKFPGAGDPAELTERALKESNAGLTYKDDIKPWLGERAAFFATPPKSGQDTPAAVVIATKDEDKARDALEKGTKDAEEKSYEGADYRLDDDTAGGVVDGLVIVGNELGFRAAVDASKGESLGESDRYDQALEGAADERVALFFVDGAAVVRQAGVAGAIVGQLGPIRRLLEQPFVATLAAKDDAIVYEQALSEEAGSLLGSFAGGATPLLPKVPGDSWLAVGQPTFGKSLNRAFGLLGASSPLGQAESQFREQTGLDLQDDVLAWMGDLVVFVRGTSQDDLGGALVIQSTDQAKSRRTIQVLQRLIRREGEARVSSLSAPGGGQGFTIRDSDVPEPIHVIQRGDQVLLAYGDDAAADASRPREELGQAPGFGAAKSSLGADYGVSTYAAVAPILELAESMGATSDSDYQEAKPYLQVFEHLIAGTRKDGEQLRTRIQFGLK